MSLDTYKVLQEEKTSIYEIVNWHFVKILKLLNNRLSLKRRFKNPFLSTVSREINKEIFYRAYRAVRDFPSSIGQSCHTERNKKGTILSYNLKFSHRGTFVHHLSKLCRLSHGEVKELLKKTFPNSCKGKYIISEEKPIIITYKLSTSICVLKAHFETINKYGNVTSY